MPDLPHTLILTGMPGTGKTSVGRQLAARLERPFVDLDEAIAAEAGIDLGAIFAAEGEAGFRARERAAVRTLAPGGPPRIVATGGGTMADGESRGRLEGLGLVVCLTAGPAVLAERLAGAPPRPLLPSPDERSLQQLLVRRRALYDSFPLQVDTTARTVADAAERCLALARAAAGSTWHSVPVATPTGGYRVVVGAGALAAVGALVAGQGLSAAALLVSDPHVAPLYADRVVAALARAGLPPARADIGLGEAAKRLETVAALYDACAAAGLGRDGVLVGLGGGVVTDTAGFAAATWLRGVAYVPLPTSLLAMVDAAIGGKTGVNRPEGKNLVGAFHQPRLVVADPAALATLPPAVRIDGLAEVMKAALIADPPLLDELETTGAPDVADLSGWTDLIVRAVRVKAEIVSADPTETGAREVLNLGHTFGHALELTTGYRLSHGQAVAVGLVAAARLGERLGHTPHGLAARIQGVCFRLGLPVGFEGPSATDVIAAMRLDKKTRGGRRRFLVPIAPGEIGVDDQVPESAVHAVLTELGV